LTLACIYSKISKVLENFDNLIRGFLYLTTSKIAIKLADKAYKHIQGEKNEKIICVFGCCCYGTFAIAKSISARRL
jgi:hypothetical protein